MHECTKSERELTEADLYQDITSGGTQHTRDTYANKVG